MQNFNTCAKAKLVKNANTNTVRLVVAFNVTQRNKQNKLMFPPQSKCAYVSGDLYTQTQIAQQLVKASKLLNTTNIVLV